MRELALIDALKQFEKNAGVFGNMAAGVRRLVPGLQRAETTLASRAAPAAQNLAHLGTAKTLPSMPAVHSGQGYRPAITPPAPTQAVQAATGYNHPDAKAYFDRSRQLLSGPSGNAPIGKAWQQQQAAMQSPEFQALKAKAMPHLTTSEDQIRRTGQAATYSISPGESAFREHQSAMRGYKDQVDQLVRQHGRAPTPQEIQAAGIKAPEMSPAASAYHQQGLANRAQKKMDRAARIEARRAPQATPEPFRDAATMPPKHRQAAPMANEAATQAAIPSAKSPVFSFDASKPLDQAGYQNALNAAIAHRNQTGKSWSDFYDQHPGLEHAMEVYRSSGIPKTSAAKLAQLAALMRYGAVSTPSRMLS